jgi:hypothetical protein
MDMRDTVESELSGFEKILDKIPGFGGYRKKERRRDADKLLRDHIYGVLTEQRRRIEDIQSQLGVEQIEFVEQIGRSRRRLQTLADTVHTAAYGYAGFFDAVRVKEDDLDALYTFDNGLVEECDAIAACIDSLQAAVDSGESLTGAIRDLTGKITGVQELFNSRKDVLTGMA